MKPLFKTILYWIRIWRNHEKAVQTINNMYPAKKISKKERKILESLKL